MLLIYIYNKFYHREYKAIYLYSVVLVKLFSLILFIFVQYVNSLSNDIS